MDPHHPVERERDEIERAIRLIDGVMRAEGVSAEELDARLGRPAGTTAALLAGGGERRQVVGILAALEIEPRVFFQSLEAELPEPRELDLPGRELDRPSLFDRLAAELALAGYGPHPSDGSADGSADDPQTAAAPDPEELERRVREAIRSALAGGDEPEDR